MSVIIPSIRPQRIERALQSVASQDWTGALDVVVVHDGGDPLAFPPGPVPITSLGCTPGVGPGEARNLAAEAAFGDLLAFLDDDDEWLSNHLSLTVPHAASTGGLVFTAALVEHVDEGWERPLQIPFRRALLRRTNPVILSSLVMPRSAFTAVGGFASDLLRYEDWDLLLRADALGLPFTEVPVPTIRYRFSSASTSANLRFMAEIFEGFKARHGLGDLPVTNFGRMAQEGVPDF